MNLEQNLTQLLEQFYSPTEPGGVVIAVKDGQVIFRRARGLAQVELGVTLEPHMVFRLASVTKQFTAVAILMLVEQGKMALTDPITKFLPNYPTHDHLITVEHLLTHTSGITSYTDILEFRTLARQDFTVQGLIDYFKHYPMHSAPGKQWAYNNSGYVLLGAILEKVSGLTYEQFIQQHIFEPLGMKNSYYDHPGKLIPGRVAGYERVAEGYVNAEYLSMTQPYAAGALASTVDDLVLWDNALYTQQLLQPETIQKTLVPYYLADGSPTQYSYGWALSEYEGLQFVEHSGSIDGFRSCGLRIPSERVYVAVLTNNPATDPALLAFLMATTIINRPYTPPPAIEVSSELLAEYVGRYEINPTEARQISYEENQLYSKRGENPKLELVPFAPDQFYFKLDTFFVLTFMRDEKQVITAVEARGRFGPAEICQKLPENG